RNRRQSSVSLTSANFHRNVAQRLCHGRPATLKPAMTTVSSKSSLVILSTRAITTCVGNNLVLTDVFHGVLNGGICYAASCAANSADRGSFAEFRSIIAAVLRPVHACRWRHHRRRNPGSNQL